MLRDGLACYRLARLITKEAGPFDVFHYLRSAVGVYDYGADGRPQSIGAAAKPLKGDFGFI